MSEPKKKTARQRTIDDQGVVNAESELARVASDYVRHLLDYEMDPGYVPMKVYSDLVAADNQLRNCRQQQECSLVVDGWPRTPDGDYVFDNMTLASCYQEDGQ